MKTIGIFEAKTRFAGICDEVADGGASIMVQRRGKPLVLITPVPVERNHTREDIYTAWKKWKEPVAEGNGDDFPEVWRMRHDRQHNPLDEG